MTAVISADQQYRYMLTREFGDLCSPDEAQKLPFVMLNPSTADASLDDPTIRRCQRFARRDGHSGIVVVNLYALRSTDPAKLWQHSDPVGPENAIYLTEVAATYRNAVCAWGANAPPARVHEVVAIFLRAGAKLLCLGTTNDGSPRHPLYVKGETSIRPWNYEAWSKKRP